DLSFIVHIFKRSVSLIVSSVDKSFMLRFFKLLLRANLFSSSMSMPTSTFEIARATTLSVYEIQMYGSLLLRMQTLPSPSLYVDIPEAELSPVTLHRIRFKTVLEIMYLLLK